MRYAYLFKDVFFDINLLHILLNSLAIGLVCFFFCFKYCTFATNNRLV
jgi:hypothetical protein